VLTHTDTAETKVSKRDREALIDATVNWLRKDMRIGGKIGAVAYGPGANQALRLLSVPNPTCPKLAKPVEAPNKIHAVFVTDPGSITNAELLAVRGPLSVAFADEDKKFAKVMKENVPNYLKRQGYPYQVSVYSHVQNGFAVRRAVTTKAEVFAKRMAFIQAITWLDEHLLDEDQ